MKLQKIIIFLSSFVLLVTSCSFFYQGHAKAVTVPSNYTLEVKLSGGTGGSGTTVKATRLKPFKSCINNPPTGSQICTNDAQALNALNNYAFTYNSSSKSYTAPIYIDDADKSDGALCPDGEDPYGFDTLNITVSGNNVGGPQAFEGNCYLASNHSPPNNTYTVTVKVTSKVVAATKGTLVPVPGTFQVNVNGTNQPFPAGGSVRIYTSEATWNAGQNPLYQATTSSGNFTIGGIAPRSYFILAQWQDPNTITNIYSASKDNFTIKAGPNQINFGTATTAKTSTLTGSGGGTASSDTTSCEATGGPLSWFVCALVTTVSGTEQKIQNDIIDPILQTRPINFQANPSCTYTGTSTGCNSDDQLSATIYSVWSNFRLYGNIVLVIALLGLVFGEVIGGGIIDAYTVKKMLPRILIAAILINLSIYIVAAMADVANILGAGLQSLAEAPFHSAGVNHIEIGGGTGAAGTFALGFGVLAFGVFSEGIAGIALFVVVLGLIAALGVLFTLLIRQGLLYFLVLSSPVAFALYCLPNTEQYFKKWWNLLLKTLMVYPIVAIIFAMANITALVLGGILGATSGANTLLYQLMSSLALVVPLFLIPFAFKLSGGAIGGIYAGISNASNKLKEPVNQWRSNNRQGRLERARNGSLFRGENRYARRSSKIAQGVMVANKAGWDPTKMRSRFRSARSAVTSANAAKASDSVAAQAVLSNDDLIHASIHGNGTEADARNYLMQLGQTGRELDQNVASITQARREMGSDAFTDAALMANGGTGTGWQSGPAEMLQAINRVAGNDRARAARLLSGVRSNAERARRADLYGAGFAVSADQLSQLHNGHTNANAVNEVMTDQALLTKSAGEIGTSRNNSLTNITGAVQRRLARSQADVATAHASGNADTIARAEHEHKRVLAATASLLDAAGSASPENARIIGALMGGEMNVDNVVTRQVVGENGRGVVDKVTGKPVMERVVDGTRRGTVGERIEQLRTDSEFQQYRREYGSGREAAAAGGEVAPPTGPPEGGGPL